MRAKPSFIKHFKTFFQWRGRKRSRAPLSKETENRNASKETGNASNEKQWPIAARIERDLLIQRTTEERKAAMARGVKFGRPPGPSKSKLDPYKEEIVALLKTGSRQTYIAKKHKCTPATLNNWIKKNEISVKEEY